ncbi:UNVERIFIED_CONTAM: protein DMP6 [Sesamum latifolium]|uniref:Protein DMP6 n=1 Tax=Sesamum latifolium TaxID=2727402 RepID=A0AAW2WLP7_9LAMI
MEIKVENDNESSQEISEQDAPLLVNKNLPQVERNAIQQAISQTFESTAHLANLLPTGSVLAFQLLSPIFSNQGECDTHQGPKGNICYGFATFRGLWIIDGSATLPPEIAAKYKLKFIDFAHALMSILVFAAIALFDENVVNCFYPAPSAGTKEMLTALPIGIGVACSMLFVVFPTKRHGIGFPVTNS